MRGEFIAVWPCTLSEIWEVLASVESAPEDIYCELYRELSIALKHRLKPEQLAEFIDDPVRSMEAFRNVKPADIAGERSLVVFFEKTYEVLSDLGDEGLAEPYFNLLSAFVEKYSLRYDLKRPCTLCPTLPGVFASLFRDLRSAASADSHLNSLLKDFENAVRDLRSGCSDDRIKTCIQKQINFLEALGARHPTVRAKTLGKICDQIGVWPHDNVKDAMKNLYTFACDYPGIRHAGTPESSKRAIDMRDFVAVTIILAGFSQYLTDRLDADVVYRGPRIP